MDQPVLYINHDPFSDKTKALTLVNHSNKNIPTDKLDQLIQSLGGNIDLYEDIDLRNNDMDLVLNAIILATSTSNEEKWQMEELMFQQPKPIATLLARLEESGRDLEDIIARMFRDYLYNNDLIPGQTWQGEDSVNRAHVARVLLRLRDAVNPFRWSNGGVEFNETVDAAEKVDNVVAAIENANLTNEIKAELIKLSDLTRPFSTRESMSPDRIQNLNNSTKDSYFRVLSEILRQNGEVFNTKIRLFQQRINVLSQINQPGIEIFEMLFGELIPQRTNAQPKAKIKEAFNIYKSIDGSTELEHLNKNLKLLAENFEKLLNGEIGPLDLLPKYDGIEKNTKSYDVLNAIGDLYFETIADIAFSTDTYREIQRTIRQAMYFKADGTPRAQTIHALVGDIGGGKSNISKFGKVGLLQHGSGTDHISGAAKSKDHVQYTELTGQWNEMRDAGYSINPMMPLFFELGCLGFRSHYDDMGMEDTGLLLDGYPRDFGQLEFFLSGDHDIDSKHNLIFLQIEGDFANPTNDLKEFITKRVIISRTFDGYGDAKARNDQFSELLVKKPSTEEEFNKNELQTLILELIKQVIDNEFNGIAPDSDNFPEKVKLVNLVYNLITDKVNGLDSIKFNPKGRLAGYRNMMDAMEKDLKAKESPVNLHILTVNQQTKPQEVQRQFAQVSVGMAAFNKLNPPVEA